MLRNITLCLLVSQTTWAVKSTCEKDVFKRLYYEHDAESYDPKYESLLQKLATTRPYTFEQIELLTHQLMQLPDPAKGSKAAKALLEMEKTAQRKAKEWGIAFGQDFAVYIAYLKLQRAVAMRLLVAGTVPEEEVDQYLFYTQRFLGSDQASLPADGTGTLSGVPMSVWRRRWVAAVSDLGRKTDLASGLDYIRPNGPVSTEPRGDELPSMFNKGLAPDLHKGVSQGTPEDHGVNNPMGYRHAYYEVLKILATDPQSLSHRSALKTLIEEAGWFAKMRARQKIDVFPDMVTRGLLEYIDDEIVPPSNRDPQSELAIRSILKQLGVTDPKQIRQF